MSERKELIWVGGGECKRNKNRSTKEAGIIKRLLLWRQH